MKTYFSFTRDSLCESNLPPALQVPSILHSIGSFGLGGAMKGLSLLASWLMPLLLLCLGAGATVQTRPARQKLHTRPLFARRDAVFALGSGLALGMLSSTPAIAKYGEYANFDDSKSSMAAGDARNKCLFAQPGSGICMVYESSEPKLYSSPDQQAAFAKLLTAAEKLGEHLHASGFVPSGPMLPPAEQRAGYRHVECTTRPAQLASCSLTCVLHACFRKAAGLQDLITASKWMAISQLLGGSRDLREAVGFLTTDAASKKIAKKVSYAVALIQCPTTTRSFHCSCVLKGHALQLKLAVYNSAGVHGS